MTEEKKKDAVSEDKKRDVEKSDKTGEGTSSDAMCADGGCCSVGGKNIFVWVIVGLAVIGLAMFVMGKKEKKTDGEAIPVSEEVRQQVTEKTEKMLSTLVPEEITVEIGEIMEVSGLYRIAITVDDQKVDSYMTKDLKKFIPQLLDMDEMEKENSGEAENTPATEVQAKNEKPVVELFVMSHCPFGTQIEKGILPVVETLGDKMDMTIKFVDYAMHGKKEVKEQLRQYCIQKNEPQKFMTYLSCFLEDGDAARCDKVLGVNTVMLNQCVAATDKTYAVTELLEDKSRWVSGQFPQFNVHKEDNEKYGVQGSPMLVINGEVIQSGRDSASLLAAVCSGFEQQPEECQTELSDAAPSPGFGSGPAATGASADAGCGV